MLSPHTFFSLGFVFGEVAKIKMTFITFHVRCIGSQADVETEFDVVLLILIFL